MEIVMEKCCCGHKGCSTYWLKGIGHFCQGSGFEKDEAELIVNAFAALRDIAATAQAASQHEPEQFCEWAHNRAIEALGPLV